MSYGANTYRYDSSGIRVQKNNTYYYWEGNKLIMEKRPDRTIFYGYDLTGIASMVIVSGSNSSSYYFKKTILGDVIEITDSNGVVLCNYYYDAWGKGSLNGPWPDIMYPDFIGNINPFRYRGYYYDTETGLYYLQSRYYDPETCRFINADDGRVLGIGMNAIGGTNLFSYCLNNPVNDVDPCGRFSFLNSLVGLLNFIRKNDNFDEEQPSEGSLIEYNSKYYKGWNMIIGFGKLTLNMGIGVGELILGFGSVLTCTPMGVLSGTALMVKGIFDVADNSMTFITAAIYAIQDGGFVLNSYELGLPIDIGNTLLIYPKRLTK